MKYLVSVEGSYGYPDSDWQWEDVIAEKDLEKTIKESLELYINDNHIESGEDIKELVSYVISEKNFYYERTGHGIHLEIKIEEV